MEQQIREIGSLMELLSDLDEKGIVGYDRKVMVNSYLSAVARMRKRPIVASFELTPLCNFDCKMCYVHLNRAQMQDRKLLTVDEWKRIIDMAVAAGVMFADITGGECLTYPGFEEVYLHLTKAGIQPSVLTNGSLLTEEMVQFFSQNRPKMIQISIYGSCAEAYRRVTGCDAFEAVMAGVNRLREAKLPFKLIVTPSRYMQEDAKALVAMLRDMRVDYGIGGITLPARPETERSMDEYQIDTDFYVKLQKEDNEFRDSLRAKLPAVEPYRFVVKGQTYDGGIPCSAGRNTFHVNWKGEMMPCISFYSVTIPLLELGFEAAWKDMQSKMATYREPKECAGCELKRYCTSCPAEKCFCTLGGPLNHGVCKRLRTYIAAGLIECKDAQACSKEVEDIHETGIC